MTVKHMCELPYGWSSYTTQILRAALSGVILFQALQTEEWIHRMSCAVKP
jgi:hypothetical protein